MRSTILATLFAFVATAFARPSGGWSGWGHGACLNQTDVDTLISGYTYLLEKPGGPDFNSTAASILSTDKFMVYSDSINSLSNRTVSISSVSNLDLKTLVNLLSL